jgi:hypothetical protein
MKSGIEEDFPTCASWSILRHLSTSAYERSKSKSTVALS